MSGQTLVKLIEDKDEDKKTIHVQVKTRISVPEFIKKYVVGRYLSCSSRNFELGLRIDDYV